MFNAVLEFACQTISNLMSLPHTHEQSAELVSRASSPLQFTVRRWCPFIDFVLFFLQIFFGDSSWHSIANRLPAGTTSNEHPLKKSVKLLNFRVRFFLFFFEFCYSSNSLSLFERYMFWTGILKFKF